MSLPQVCREVQMQALPSGVLLWETPCLTPSLSSRKTLSYNAAVSTAREVLELDIWGGVFLHASSQ
jgi:hypothetical protein